MPTPELRRSPRLDNASNPANKQSAGQGAWGEWQRRCRMRSVLRATAGLALGVAASAFSSPALSADEKQSASTFGLEERTACHRAVEKVRWQNRRWPDENPGAKPPLSEVMSDAEIRRKAEDAVRMSAALAELYDEPITADMLQAEIERMARDTRAPDQLEQLFAALDNDAFLIAECLARPELARRKLYKHMTRDTAIHGSLRDRAQAELLGVANLAHLEHKNVQTYVYVAKEESRSEKHGTGNHQGRAIYLDRQQWKDLRAQLGLGQSPAGAPPAASSGSSELRLEESDTAFYARQVVTADAERIRLRRVRWSKQGFDEWWYRNRAGFDAAAAVPSKGLTVPTVTGTAGTAAVSQAGAEDYSWYVRGAPIGRRNHTAVWTGTEMIVWGGEHAGDEVDTGGRYDPAIDNWTPTPTMGAPEDRDEHTAVWTGSEMIVWGGKDTFDSFNSGGRYDPGTDTWTATATSGAPSGRSAHTAVWTGSEMIVWGGGGSDIVNTGGRYDPSADSWTATATSGAPSPQFDHTAVWTGSEMIVWGGQDGSNNAVNTGGRYDPATDSWTATATSAAPTARDRHSAVWTGGEMLVWGGRDASLDHVNTGGSYDPSANSWTQTATGGAPTGRQSHTAVWTGSEIIVWGGEDASFDALNSGGRYDPDANSWTATATSGAPSGRESHTAVWTGNEMIVWGGLDDSTDELHTGGRYNPAADVWTPTATSDAPARVNHTAVWTGSEMIVWGGNDASSGTPNTGGRYDPSTDSWTAPATSDAPIGRTGHTAVWTGSEMVVWGGQDDAFPAVNQLNSGGRYNPATDSWTETATSGAPNARTSHTAVWTGGKMVVWGGYEDGDPVILFNSGGRYDPATDTWTATSTSGAPSGRSNHTAVWTGNEMIVWGGYGQSQEELNTGGRYDPAAESWTATATTGAPDSRERYTAVWSGSEMIIWGGRGGASLLNTGARYDPVTDNWVGTSTTDAPAGRWRHTAVWTGNEMIIWGGGGDLPRDRTGGHYDPATDSWTATATEGAPTPRSRHTAVWTGDAMIIALGNNSQNLREYGVYSTRAGPELIFTNSFE